MRMTSETISEKRRHAGLKGGHATLLKYGPGHMKEIGKLGGRPRSLTLAEIERRQCSRQTDTSKEQRRNSLPSGTLSRRLRELLNMKAGESVVCGTSGFPERSN